MPALPIRGLIARQPALDRAQLEEVFLGCANRAGEDNRNVARMSLRLAGLPASVPGVTINRLCGSGLDAVGTAARSCGYFAVEIIAVNVPGGKAGDIVAVAADEHIRGDTTRAAPARLATLVRTPGTVTAGNASGINDGA